MLQTYSNSDTGTPISAQFQHKVESLSTNTPRNSGDGSFVYKDNSNILKKSSETTTKLSKEMLENLGRGESFKSVGKESSLGPNDSASNIDCLVKSLEYSHKNIELENYQNKDVNKTNEQLVAVEKYDKYQTHQQNHIFENSKTGEIVILPTKQASSISKNSTTKKSSSSSSSSSTSSSSSKKDTSNPKSSNIASGLKTPPTSEQLQYKQPAASALSYKSVEMNSLPQLYKNISKKVNMFFVVEC